MRVAFLPTSDLQEPNKARQEITMHLQVPFSKAVELNADV